MTKAGRLENARPMTQSSFTSRYRPVCAAADLRCVLFDAPSGLSWAANLSIADSAGTRPGLAAQARALS